MALSNRKIVYICSIAAAVTLLLTGLHNLELSAADRNTECFSRCGNLTGSARRVCVEECAKRAPSEYNEKSSARRRTVREKTEFCDSFCASYQGLEAVKCRRVCLDKYDEFEKSVERAVKDDTTSDKENAVEDTVESRCEKRCGTLNEPHKSECLLKCKRNSR